MNDEELNAEEAAALGNASLPEGTYLTTDWLDKKIRRGEARATLSEPPPGAKRYPPIPGPSLPHATEVLGRMIRALLDHASAELQPHIVESYSESITVFLSAYERLALAHHQVLALAGSGSDPVGTLLNIAEASRQALLLPFLDPAILAHLDSLRPAPSLPTRRTMRFVKG
jgi:hypothetical protein